MTLTEFLLARIAEDEAVAQDSLALYVPGSSLYVARHDPARVLAECEAKRRIVEQWRNRYNENPWLDDDETLDARDALRALASVYVDHPDCRDEWKPSGGLYDVYDLPN